MGLNKQHFIFFVTYETAHKARVFHYTILERLDRKTTLAYWAHLSAMKKIKGCEYGTRAQYYKTFYSLDLLMLVISLSVCL